MALTAYVRFVSERTYNASPDPEASKSLETAARAVAADPSVRREIHAEFRRLERARQQLWRAVIG